MIFLYIEQAEASEEEVGCGDEEDTRNMEDDSINLMLEDEEKMLEDELTFNEPDRHEQVRRLKLFICFIVSRCHHGDYFMSVLAYYTFLHFSCF